ncbi:MAG: hypothetical protein ACI4AA_09430 [Lachnospiraceae bacterium]
MMMNKKRRICFIFILFVCIAVCIICLCVGKRMQSVVKTRMSYESRFDRIHEVYEGKNGAVAIVTENDIDVPVCNWLGNGYLAGSRMDYTIVSVSGKSKRVDLDTAEICLYDIFEKRVVKTIDLKPVIEEYAKGYYYLNHMYVVSADGRCYAEITVSDYSEEKNLKEIYIDLDTEEVSVMPGNETLPGLKRSERQNDWIDGLAGETALYNSVDDFLREKGFSIDLMIEDGVLEKKEYNTNVIKTRVEGTYDISVLWSSVSKDSEVLEEYFPGLKDYNAQSDDMVTFFITGYPDKEEIMDILQILQ